MNSNISRLYSKLLNVIDLFCKKIDEGKLNELTYLNKKQRQILKQIKNYGITDDNSILDIATKVENNLKEAYNKLETLQNNIKKKLIAQNNRKKQFAAYRVK